MNTSSPSHNAGALAGVRVLELGSFLAGPFAATLLADFGAEVIKVEPPDGPDIMRHMFGPVDARDKLRSLKFMALARNKKSVTLNLKTPEGRALFFELARACHVLVENFRPGQMEKMGLGPAEVHASNPRLIYLRVSGWGQSGPYRGRPGVDDAAVAFGGLSHLTGFPDGPPQRSGMTVADHGAGLLGAYGVALALLAQKNGNCAEGQVIDVSLYDPILMMLDEIPAAFERLGLTSTRSGNSHENAAPSGVYRAGDGRWVAVSAVSDQLFGRLADIMGLDAAERAALAASNERVKQRARLDRLIEAWVGGRPAGEVVQAVANAGVPVAIVNDMQSMLSDPHMAERGDFQVQHDPLLGDFRQVAPKPLMSRTPGSLRLPAPRFGEHTDAVLSSLLKLSPERLAELRGAKVI
jgi:formyl-CoA transferase